MSRERSKGRFLTKGQREYLIGNHKPETKNAEYVLESRIRSRIKAALFEFKIINQYISDDMLETLFEDWTRLPKSINTDHQLEMRGESAEIESIISMAYRGYRLNGMDQQEFTKAILQNALIQAEADRTGESINNVTADLELNELKAFTEPNELDPVEKWDKGLALTREEQEELYDRVSDKVDRKVSLSEVGDLIEEYLIDPQENGEK